MASRWDFSAPRAESLLAYVGYDVQVAVLIWLRFLFIRNEPNFDFEDVSILRNAFHILKRENLGVSHILSNIL